MTEEHSNVEQRLQNGIYGSPKIKPDEQRRYLGTFRERMWLTISVAEAKQQDWSDALRQELTIHPDSLVIINGNIDDSLTRNYLTVANNAHVQFTIKTGTETKTGDDDLAVIVTDHKAVYQSPVDVSKKYGQQSPQDDQQTKHHPSLLKRIFHL